MLIGTAPASRVKARCRVHSDRSDVLHWLRTERNLDWTVSIGSFLVRTAGAAGEALTALGGTETTPFRNPLLQKSADADGIADAILAVSLNVPCDAYDPQKPVAECMNSISAYPLMFG